MTTQAIISHPEDALEADAIEVDQDTHASLTAEVRCPTYEIFTLTLKDTWLDVVIGRITCDDLDVLATVLREALVEVESEIRFGRLH